ncbi:hypothetical protein QE152_g25419 [Popillia japonica]|uniref:Uncharacterized protein n=1 Tax=Popillia japonica TaxID=7064 RepID=A0AAW1K2V2_POPJA
MTNDLLKGPLNLEIFNTFQEVNDDFLTCEYPSELEIAAAVATTQLNENLDSEEENEESESLFEIPIVQQVFNAMKTLCTYLEFNHFENIVNQKFYFI